MPPARRRTKPGKTDSPGMQIEVDGRTYVVRESDLTPRDVAALRRETGFAGWVGLAAEAQRGFDLDVLAALVWLARRIGGETVPFETVLDEMSYQSDLNVTVEDKRKKSVIDGETVDSPEA